MPEFSKNQWLEICPGLTIETMEGGKQIGFSGKTLEELARSVWRDGYLLQEPVFRGEELDPVCKGLQALATKGIPPVYIYLFDQPWILFSKLNRLISHFLGDGFALLPNLWAWYFDKPGERGWRPHHDCHLQTVFDIGGDQMLMSLSLWIPLTDVNEENGCMYVLPRSREGVLKTNPDMEQSSLEPYAVALPAKAGSVLGWPQDVVHWGGRYSEAATIPRASLSLEFQNSSFDPLVAPFLDAASPPVFEERLRLIRTQYEKYKHIVAENEVRAYFT